MREVEEHKSLVKNLKKKKLKWVLKKTIQAKPTSQNTRKSNPNTIFTQKKTLKSESIKNPTKLTRKRFSYLFYDLHRDKALN